MMEFHVSRASRDKYQFDQVLFSQNGNVIFANFQAARQFAAQINAQKKTEDKGYVSPGQINALGLIDEIFHLIVAEYYQEYGRDIREALYTELITKLGKEKVESSLEAFLNEFPPVDVYQGNVSLKDYLAGETAGVSHYQLALEELLMLWLPTPTQRLNRILSSLTTVSSKKLLLTIKSLMASKCSSNINLSLVLKIRTLSQCCARLPSWCRNP